MLSEQWKKSKRSGGGDGNCVEARRVDNKVEVRHSKHPGGTTLRFTRAEWVAFVGGVRDGDFDVAD